MAGNKTAKYFREGKENMKSAYEIVKEILANPKLNYVRVNYAGHAKAKIDSWFRTQTGETTNHIKRSHFFADRLTSSRSTSLLLSMARDSGSRNEDGEYDYRSLMLADLNPDTLKPQLNISEIMVAENFDSYRPIDLGGRPIFPAISDEAAFATNLLELRGMEARKELMSKKMSALKKNLDKNGIVDQMGYRISWRKPEGTTEVILDGSGNEVKKNPTASLGFQLHPTENVKVDFKASDYSTNNIVELWNEIKELGKKIKVKMAELRPFELGIMERLTDVTSPFMVGGVEFSVKSFKGASYENTPEEQAKVIAGEYKIGSIPKSKGSWECDMIAPPSTETETTVEPETVTV
jgi:hypothetical protein